jgi:hypothetical protein
MLDHIHQRNHIKLSLYRRMRKRPQMHLQPRLLRALRQRPRRLDTFTLKPKLRRLFQQNSRSRPHIQQSPALLVLQHRLNNFPRLQPTLLSPLIVSRILQRLVKLQN